MKVLEPIDLTHLAKLISIDISISEDITNQEDRLFHVLKKLTERIVERCNDNCIAELSDITSEGKLSKEERWNKTVWKKAIDKTLTQIQ